MSFLNVKNNAASTLASGITDSATSLTVATGEGALFPSSNFHITIDNEIILCSSRSGDVFTIERAKEGTSAAAHSADADVELRVTAQHISDLNTAVTALESAPPAHASLHENGGADEISVAGLSGELADAQPPKAHASDHQSGGSDAIKLDDLAAPDDNTDLNASATKHGLLPKLENSGTKYLRDDGTWQTPSGGGAFSSRARVYRDTSNQTIDNETVTIIQLNAESYDGDGEFNTSAYRFTAANAGYYLINCNILCSDAGAGHYILGYIYKNGAQATYCQVQTAFAGYFVVSFADILYLAASDYIDLRIWHNKGSDDLLVRYAESKTFMAVHRLS